MDNIRACIDIIFNHTPPDFIIEKINPLTSDILVSQKVDQNWFCSHLGSKYTKFTNSQTSSIFNILESTWACNPDNKFKKQKSVFNIPLHFVNEVLGENHESPYCKYKELLRWRELSLLIGEDFLTASYFANKDIQNNRARYFFSWDPIISHNNNSIHNITHKGLTELHYHLFGSTLVFDLNWLSLMNDIDNRESSFQKIKTLQNLTVSSSSKKYIKKSYYELYLIASKIRTYLFKTIFSQNNINEKVLDFKDISIMVGNLKNEIELLKYFNVFRFKGQIIDYAIDLTDKELEDKYYINSILNGERRILYHCLKYIYAQKDHSEYISNLLFLYIVIKNKIRNEFIQNNNKIGFDNFSIYQDRKDYFIKENSIYSKIMAEIAVKSSFNTKNLKYLEARITPKKYVKELKTVIERIDKSVIYKEPNDFCLRDKSIFRNTNNSISCLNYGYIIHFLKKVDKKKENEFYSRHYILRQEVCKQAIAINKFRELGSKVASRIWGIDAASSEMNARPEVFAQAMRYLRNNVHVNENPNLISLTIPKLGFTYHVGEDNMDIVDGLRSIEEVIYFFRFENCDRLGHALVVGLDVKEYYKRRNNYVVMSKGELLDNLVWLKHKAMEVNANFPSSCIDKIRELTHYIYNNKLGNSVNINSDMLYDAWLLRGDNPESYRGEINENPCQFNSYDNYSLNDEIECQIARKNDEACSIYRLYHFDKDVKLKSYESVEFKIDNEFIYLVIMVQNNIREKIARKGLYIETNPSSNYKIGEMERYSQHPIKNFYNVDLCDKITDYQLCVSINTDDLGVFSTSLENEYAVLALALEKEKNEDGTPKYQPRMIYKWLDSIREQGFEQRFNRCN